jgi:hypothetical protein
MAQREPTGTGIGLDDLAEPHVKSAIDRLGKLVYHEDARIALEASQLILRIARPQFAGGGAPAGGFVGAPGGGVVGPGGGMPGGGWGPGGGVPMVGWGGWNPWGNPWDIFQWGGHRAG